MRKVLKQAVDLPMGEITKAVKKGAKLAQDEAERLLPKSGYEMTFDDGAQYDPDDIRSNLYIRLEKSSRRQKRVARVGIKDWKVDRYSNFVEFGYHDKKNNYKYYPATHFMRDGLTNVERQVNEEMVENLRESLDKLK